MASHLASQDAHTGHTRIAHSRTLATRKRDRRPVCAPRATGDPPRAGAPDSQTGSQRGTSC
eukprot:375182-Prymnesium_polylepis.3